MSDAADTFDPDETLTGAIDLSSLATKQVAPAALHLRAPDHEQAIQKADTLIEALPWLQQFNNRIIVVKFGGNAMTDAAQLDSFADDIAFMKLAGIHPVVVHGGGPQISKALAERGITSEFRGGLRVTTPEAMAVVAEVLTGQVRSSLVTAIDRHGAGLAIGFAGNDEGLFLGKQRGTIVDGVEVDLGRVGDVVEVRPDAVLAAIADSKVPVVSTIAPDADGELLNVNADAAAAALAVALGAAKLVILTDVEGLYADWPNRDSLVASIGAAELRALLPRLESGMIPKMTACLEAVEGGVDKAAIVDGRREHSVLLEIFTQSGIGTEVVPDHTASKEQS